MISKLTTSYTSQNGLRALCKSLFKPKSYAFATFAKKTDRSLVATLDKAIKNAEKPHKLKEEMSKIMIDDAVDVKVIKM